MWTKRKMKALVKTQTVVGRRWCTYVKDGDIRVWVTTSAQSATCLHKKRPAKKMLGIWPAIPIVVSYNGTGHQPLLVQGTDHIISALEHRDRVCGIKLWGVQNSLWQGFTAMMQEPFPALTCLILGSGDGESAPALPDLFHSPRLGPDSASRRPPRLPLTILPALTEFWFHGVSEFLEDIVARIDAPLLQDTRITFFNQLIFDTPQLLQFLGRTKKLKALNHVDLILYDRSVKLTLHRKISTAVFANLRLEVPCREADWQISLVSQVCSSSLPFLAILESLDIREGRFSQPLWEYDIEKTQWLELLHPFTAVKDLYLSGEPGRRVMRAVNDLPGGLVTDVLPALQNIFIQEVRSSRHMQLEEIIGTFVAARRLSGFPVVGKDGSVWGGVSDDLASVVQTPCMPLVPSVSPYHRPYLP
ncbi:hypothetical protein F5148DRAFT_1146440 [Russula earlei]|uniref:Uncharacterized protein n=1 Tax=Russula earlei TaxID=71964 RepID=A0ACC0UJR3_9AGAM|nr:hypothetical protein F5148DRAFT_1146440 [Russula earlei]